MVFFDNCGNDIDLDNDGIPDAFECAEGNGWDVYAVAITEARPTYTDNMRYFITYNNSQQKDIRVSQQEPTSIDLIVPNQAPGTGFVGFTKIGGPIFPRSNAEISVQFVPTPNKGTSTRAPTIIDAVALVRGPQILIFDPITRGNGLVVIDMGKDGNWRRVNDPTAFGGSYYNMISPDANDNAFTYRRVTSLPTAPISCDVDGDGIPNNLDGDSDGDGCPDLVENMRISDYLGLADYSLGDTTLNPMGNPVGMNGIFEAFAIAGTGPLAESNLSPVPVTYFFHTRLPESKFHTRQLYQLPEFDRPGQYECLPGSAIARPDHTQFHR